MSKILTLMFAFLNCFCKVSIKRCLALRSMMVEASPVAGAVAVSASSFCGLFSLEQALNNKLEAKAQARKI